MKSENSYGIIPFYKNNDEIKVFLIHQISRTGDLIWTFAKGREENGESPTDTAVREVYEETGLRPKIQNEEKTYSLEYEFVFEEAVIKKSTTYFAGIVESPTFTIQEKEVKEAGWFTIDKALEKLTYGEYKDILNKAVSDLDF